MSGRRRHDDGWDDGRLDAQDDRRDPWADESIGEWAEEGTAVAEAADRPRTSSGGAAGAYVRNAPPSAQAYAAPDFPSFQAVAGPSGADRRGNDPGRAGQRASGGYAPPRHASGGHPTGGQRDAGYGGGRDGYQSAGYERSGSNSGAAGRHDSAGYDTARHGGDSAAGRYRQSANAPGGRSNDPGYGGGAGYGSAGARGHVPEFMPIDSDDADDDGPTATPRPYGRLSIYTLHGDKTREFDRFAERAAEGVRTLEPDTLVYVIHVVPKAPQQRIIYEIYRDRAAFMSHERQPHIRQFAADRASCVVATNIIDLRLKFAKVAALGSPSDAAAQGRAQQQAGWAQRGAATQYAPSQPSPPPPPPQYPATPSPGAGTRVATFTPATDRNAPDSNQYPAAGRDAPSPAPQYGKPASGAYGTGNPQYGAANSNGYSGTAGYTNAGSYSSNAYPGPNGNSGANGYQSTSGANSNGSGYSNRAANGGGNGYGASGGYPGNGAPSYSASATTQYAPRYRELTSGAAAGAGTSGHSRSADRYQDDGGQSGGPQSSEWESRPQGYR